jgi:hypothetical protein
VSPDVSRYCRTLEGTTKQWRESGDPLDSRGIPLTGNKKIRTGGHPVPLGCIASMAPRILTAVGGDRPNLASMPKPMSAAKVKLLVVLVPLVCVAACGKEDARPNLKVTSRDGHVFEIAHAEVNYERICEEGSFPADGDPEHAGLRVFTADVDPPSTQGKVIPWSSINRVAFSSPIGDLGNSWHFCVGPLAIAATVTFHDGHQEQQQLIDTTDWGLTGTSERGKITIPLRNIARLDLVKDAEWPWVTSHEPNVDAWEKMRREVTLHVVEKEGGRLDLHGPDTELGREKFSGNDSLALPVRSLFGLPILVGGAEFVVPWTDIAKVEFKGAEPTMANVTYRDGKTDSAQIEDASLDAAGSPIPLGEIAEIDVRLAGAQ